MAKKENGCWCCSRNGWGAALIIIGLAYALQHGGVLFSNVVLWPWVMIALGICLYLFKD